MIDQSVCAECPVREDGPNKSWHSDSHTAVCSHIWHDGSYWNVMIDLTLFSEQQMMYLCCSSAISSFICQSFGKVNALFRSPLWPRTTVTGDCATIKTYKPNLFKNQKCVDDPVYYALI